jgi:hypothetical protein
VWFSDILSNTLGSQGGIVDFEQFLVDAANGTLPRFSIIAPDGNYDAHDGSPATADAFLSKNLQAIFSLPDFQSGGSGLLFITFDNGDADVQGQVYTALIGPNVKSGFISQNYYQHQNALRTILDALGIQTYPGGAAGAADMSEFFKTGAGGVVVDSPPSRSVQGTSVQVRASAVEQSTTIDHIEVWDNGIKLGNVFNSAVDQSFDLKPGAHAMTVQDIGPGPAYAVLHKQVTNFSVSSNDGVFITAPANNSLQASLFPLTAYAVDSSGSIDHLEVWADGKKLGDSPKGSTISQWYNSLQPGSHLVTVESVSSGGTTLRSATVNVTITSANAVYVNSPAQSSTQGSQVEVNAYAYEQTNSNQQIDHLEVWDNGVKLGNSPLGYGVSSLFTNQTYTLKSGAHQMVIEDVGPNYSVVHKTTINFTVQ